MFFVHNRQTTMKKVPATTSGRYKDD